MGTLRLFCVLIVLCLLCPASSIALSVYVIPPAPSELDSVSIVGVGCNFFCESQISVFDCIPIDAHTYGITAQNYGVYCLPETLGGECFACTNCYVEFEMGRFAAGRLAPGHYVIQIWATLDLGPPSYSELSFDVQAVATAVGPVPSAAQLAVAPNPFASSANIEFALSKRSHATLEVFDVRGGRVRTLLDESIGAPAYTAQWDGRDASGRRQPSGVYFARLTLDGVAVATRRIVLLR
jgi:hypothetical protein